MTRIPIPPRLDERLGQSPLAHPVRAWVQRFESWVGDDTQGLFFFPEYTDHGPKHIASVLVAAEALIREEAWPHLTGEDAAVLILATVLHDSAMHLTADGLLDLLGPSRAAARPRLDLLGTKTWPELFDDFFAEARRWDQRKLHRILGDAERSLDEEEGDLVDSVRRPADVPNPETWSTRYRKFLGEFVRRHHARLAHEIALEGVPGSTPGELRLPADLESVADLAGLVARSHNMALRDTFGYLQQRYYGRVKCRNTHPIFLMVLLRVADYLEIRSDRTGSTRLQIQRLRSPISLEEHKAHLSVDEVRPDEHDAEAVFVIAHPWTSRLFLKLRDLLQGLQAELDTSWAVLGEVFSRQGDLRDLGLNLRRVRSNLDDPAQFVKQAMPSYFPVRAAFETAGADLLKLLIQPLYGSQPSIGIRELIQNSVDAVLERQKWENNHDHRTMGNASDPSSHDSDVLVSIESDEYGMEWVTVRDSGIGMTADTVRNYFLRAGASYRQSDSWRQQFESSGKAIVRRSGRFGIGALAAFLIGNRIEVRTRHAADQPEDGVHISATLQDDHVELSRLQMDTIGTTIRIPLNPEHSGKYLSLDWFTLSNPKVELWRFGKAEKQDFTLPSPEESATSDWRTIYPEDYEAVLWTYAEAPHLTCNGFIIQRFSFSLAELAWPFAQAPFYHPSVSVFDPDGKLPLTLQRDKLQTTNLPFSRDLLQDIVAELCAFLLLYAPTKKSSSRKFLPTGPLNEAFFSLSLNFQASFIWAGREGSGLLYPSQLKHANIRRILWLIYAHEKACEACLRLPDVDAVIYSIYEEPSSEDDSNLYVSTAITGIVPRWCRILASSSSSLLQEVRASLGDLPPFRQVANSAGWQTWEGGEPLYEKVALEEIGEQIEWDSAQGLIGAMEWHIDAESIQVTHSPVTEALDSLLDSPVIPYDPARRLQALPRAFEALRDRLPLWEPPKLDSWRKDLVDSVKGGSYAWTRLRHDKGRFRGL